MDDDGSLLRIFATTRSEAAFTELVRRHAALVFSVALRQLGGDAHRAQDATQAVFCELAAQARRLSARTSIAGWLYNTSRFVAARLRRSEVRREQRENRYIMETPIETPIQTSTEPPNLALWIEIEPLLDDAMQQLPSADREAVILRFFQNQPLSAVGNLLQTSEDAARMRINRAIEKLRCVLEKRGVRSSSAVLSGLLAAHAITTPPAALASLVIGPAVATAATTGVAGLSILSVMASTKLKIATAAVALAAAGSGLVVQSQQQKQLRHELDLSRARVAELQQQHSSTPDVRISDSDQRRADHSELLRLRGAVTQLRDDLARERKKQVPSAVATAPSRVTPEQQQEINRTIGLGKLNFTRFWAHAIHEYARANHGQMPPGFPEAAAFLPEIPNELSWIHGTTGPQDFEILYRGSLNDVAKPARTIIAREKQPFDLESNGAAKRTYLFADGHSEIHRAADGDFERWERERMAPPGGEGVPGTQE